MVDLIHWYSDKQNVKGQSIKSSTGGQMGTFATR